MADRCRKYMLEIMNPIDKGFTHEVINELIPQIGKAPYWCLSDEIGIENKTFHTHVYVVFENAICWKTIQKYFPNVHRDMCMYSTSVECRNYVFKEGKWLTTEKADTNIRESHEEHGEMPVERPGKRTDLDMLYSMIKDGLSTYEILEENPRYMLQIEKIDKARKVYQEEMFKDTWRDLDVTYIWGATGTGKTRGVKEKFGYSNVYTVTDYAHPFDGYTGQDVILFEEYRSNLKIGDMLQYLDGYPLELPCRYANKIACYTKVFFCTNIDLRQQYRDIQRDYPETWQAFLRRITRVQVHESLDSFYIMDTNAYLCSMFHFFNSPPKNTYVSADDDATQEILDLFGQ